MTIFRLIASLTFLFTATTNADAPRPNIILIVADDMGYSDIGCYGGEIATPNIDRLASEGLRYSQFYNCSVCGPSRASLMTGLYPHQIGVRAWNDIANNRCMNLGEALQGAGYRTMLVGKWTDTASANYKGFERSLSALAQKGPGNYFKSVSTADFYLDKEPFTPPAEHFYKTDAYTDYAIQFMEEAATIDKPFFLLAAYPAPHWPLHAKEEDIAKYRKRYLELGWDQCRADRLKRIAELGLVKNATDPPRDAAVPPWSDAPNKEWEAERMAVYAAQIDCMDQNIGRLLDALKKIGREDNTMVIFLSDNGATDIFPKAKADGSFYLDEENKTWRTDGTKTRPVVPGVMPGPADTFGGYGPEWAHVSNAPFRGYKTSNFEGGIATPLIIKFPGHITHAGSISNEIGHVKDIMPTLLEVAGSAYPTKYQDRELLPLEGLSLTGTFEGWTDMFPSPIFWELGGHRAVREGAWKIVSVPEGPWQLYNLSSDRGELNDLAAKRPEILKELVERYTAWSARCNEGR